ncbi:M14 family zinc carboxypeptidase [Janibacter sp. GXQ6167]|uniref:M14 family metallopeptidase n=1 Tax=Janibacter sp. GXQ6167 TaxID=3240791 RepID=UPI003524C589
MVTRTRAAATAVVLSGALLAAATPTFAGASAPAAPTAPTTSADDDYTTKLVTVEVTSQKARTKVAGLGLDVTSKVTPKGLQVILHSKADEKKLRDAGLSWKVKDADLAKTVRTNRAKDRAYDRRVTRSGLPSGRTTYRTLDETNAEIDALARRYPGLVRTFTLPNRTVDGRTVRGFEVTTDAKNIEDGKPVLVMMGAIHAREWPTVDHTMEFAYDLLQGYGRDARITKIVKNERVIFVPVVNPDGFHVSRSAEPLGNFSQFDYEMKRKNCSISSATPERFRGGTCDDNPAGRLRGTDLNRNFPGFWGGPGASATWSSDTFRGDGPGSEPETDNMRKLISSRQVTGLISNHTYSNLVLRPPSIASTGASPDEPLYKALGESMTNANGYTNQASYQLYDTSGSTEDWSYWITGGLGFTFEISPNGFHEAYEDAVVAEYLGKAPAAGAGKGGNREAYLRMAEANMNPKYHSTIVGKAPASRRLLLSKSFTSQTSPVIQPGGVVGEPITYADTLTSALDPKTGNFRWAVNPSTRPLVAGRWGRDALAPQQPTITLTNPEGTPAVGQSERTTFTIEGMPKYDNAKAEVRVGWPGGADWDVYILDADGNTVGSAASLANPEVAVLIDPKPGQYTVVVENYEGGNAAEDWTGEVRFLAPDPKIETGIKESWTLSCVDKRDRVLATREVVVDRGQTVDVGNVCQKPKKGSKK